MKELRKSLLTFVIYLFVPFVILYTIKYGFNIVTKDNLQFASVINIILDVILFVTIVFLNKDIFKNRKRLDTKEDKISLIIKLIILMYAIKIVSGMVVGILSFILGVGVDTSNNQYLLEEMFKYYPVLMIITGVICAPVTEELVFRGAIKRIIKNKKVFIIVSGLIFGLIHVLRYDLPVFIMLIGGYLIDMIVESKLDRSKNIKLSIVTTLGMLLLILFLIHILSGSIVTYILTIKLSEVLNSIVYIAVGCYFAYIYQKYDNIYVNIGAHMANNLLSYIILFTSMKF